MLRKTNRWDPIVDVCLVVGILLIILYSDMLPW